MADESPRWSSGGADLIGRFRSVLGRRLVGEVLHELRNPLNAISLNGDLISHLLGQPLSEKTVGQLRSRAVLIKERLRELEQRQNRMALLWLADPSQPTESGAPPLLIDAIEGAAKLVRDHLSQRDVLLSVEGLDALAGLMPRLSTAGLQLALAAWLMMAAEGMAASNGQPHRLKLKTSLVDAKAVVELEGGGALAFAGVGRELGLIDASSTAFTLAALCGCEGGAGIDIEEAQPGLRMRIAA